MDLTKATKVSKNKQRNMITEGIKEYRWVTCLSFLMSSYQKANPCLYETSSRFRNPVLMFLELTTQTSLITSADWRDGIPPKFPTFLQIIGKAVAVGGSVLLLRSLFICVNNYFIFQIYVLATFMSFCISLFRYLLSWLGGLQTAKYSGWNF